MPINMQQSMMDNSIAHDGDNVDDDVLTWINNILENFSQRMYLVMREYQSTSTIHQPLNIDLDRTGIRMNEIEQQIYQRMLLLFEDSVDSIAELCIFAPLRRLPRIPAMKGSDTSVSDDKVISTLAMTGMDVMSTGRLWDENESGSCTDNAKMQHLSLQLAWHMAVITLPKNVVANLGLVLKRLPERCYSMELVDIGSSNFHILALELKHDLLAEADTGMTVDDHKLPFTVFDAFVMGVLGVLKVFGDGDMPSQFAFARLRVRMSNPETVVSVFEQAVSSDIQPFDDMESPDRSGMMEEAEILLALFYVTLQACDS
ncbi:hypothetical protein HDU76_007666, partial [Blyttiomyces sp. JEL0837]